MSALSETCSGRKPLVFILFTSLIALSVADGAQHSALADSKSDSAELKAIAAQLQDQAKHLAEQEDRLKHQQEMLLRQNALIQSQRKELTDLQMRLSSGAANDAGKAVNAAAPETVKRQASPEMPARTANASPSNRPAEREALPASPVGQASKQEQPPQIVQSLPERLAVLTPQGHLIFTPSLEYTQTTNDRLVYQGVVIVPGLNLGEVSASTDDRSIAASVFDIRYGLAPRLEIEARVPLMFSDDRATVLTQGPNGSATQSVYISGKGLGDVEMAARYQVNNGLDEWPVIVANARVKSDTGLGPFDIKRNSAGIAQQVSLGSGFWGFEGGFSLLKVADPAVLFSSVNFVYQMPKDINRTIGNVLVGRVEPSSSVSVSLGFGFAVNPDFSFSLGYEHSYVLPQYTMLGSTKQNTTSLQVGALTVGAAYRLAPNMSFNSNFEFGVTHDAPDVRAVFSLPISY